MQGNAERCEGGYGNAHGRPYERDHQRLMPGTTNA